MTLYGVGGLDATLAARSLLGAGYVFTNGGDGFPGRYVLWFIPADTQFPMVYSNQPIPALHPHFPYGFLVEADGPV